MPLLFEGFRANEHFKIGNIRCRYNSAVDIVFNVGVKHVGPIIARRIENNIVITLQFTR